MLNDTAWAYEYRPVTDMLEEQTAAHPGKTAVVSARGSLTYRELNGRANRVAHALREQGLGSEDTALIFLPRSIGTYIATWGILKAGAAFVVANLSYPDDRVDFMYRDSGARCIITDGATLAARGGLLRAEGVCCLLLEELLQCPDERDLRLPIGEEQLCYCIYTSGSTGRPKGVLIEHGNLTNFVMPGPKNRETMGLLERGSVMLAMAPMTFDVSIMEEFIALTGGMTLALAGDAEILDPALMKAFILDHGVDAVCMTPAYLNTLVSIPDLHPAIRQLKVADMGAEAFPGALYTRLAAVNPELYIMNGYGPTEATISCTMKVITSPDRITIGVPNANVFAYIVDEQLNELPQGEVGELLICGRGVGRGYRGLPEKTAASFVTFRGMRGYRTGDQALIDENGEIEFHGRKDNQVKLRGLRIELGEVEEALSRHPAVKQCAALAVDNRYLVAYYSLNEPVTREELKDFVKQSLAHYMVPDIFMPMDELPMTANRKIDRKALPRPVIEGEQAVPPQNDTQRRVLNIMRDVVTDLPESITAPLKDFGLSSLDAMVLMARLEESFGVHVRMADIFAHGTAEEMAVFLDAAPRRQAETALERYPVTEAQQDRFKSWREHTDGGAMVMEHLLLPDASVDADRLAAAVDTAVNAHPALLASFLEADGALWQKPAPESYVYRCERVSVSDGELAELSASIPAPAFDLLGGKPVVLFRIYEAPAGLALYFAVDHMVMDGGSEELLFEDIARAYEQGSVQPEGISFFAHMAELSRSEKQDAMACDALIRSCVGSGRPCVLPEDGPNLSGEFFVTRPLEASKAEVQARCRAGRYTEACLFFGCMALALSEASGGDQVSFVTQFNGRSDSRLNRVVGELVQTVPAFCDLQPDRPVLDWLHELQARLAQFMSYPAVAAASAERQVPDIRRRLMIYQPNENAVHTLGGAPLTEVPFRGRAITPAEGSGEIPMDLFVQLLEQPEAFVLILAFNPLKYTQSAMNRLAERMDRMLGRLQPGMTLGDVLKA